MDEDESISANLAESFEKHRRRNTTPSGTLVLSDAEGYVGEEVTARGRNLPEDTTLDVLWHTSTGSWGVLQGTTVKGPQYRSRVDALGTVRTDETGTFDETFEIPASYGGGHTVEVRDEADGSLGRAEIEILPRFELENDTAALGDTFTIRGYGLGPNPLTNIHHVAYDNSVVGYMTGVLNDGTATAQLRATGGVGEHGIQIWRGYRGEPFLQSNTQSPFGPVAGGRTSKWRVQVTEPESRPPAAWTDPQAEESPLSVHYPDLDEDTAAELEITPTSGTVGTTATLQGRNFPPDTAVDLVWYRHEGHRVKGIPITPVAKPDVLPTVQTDADGSFEHEFDVPSDVGSTRPITAEVDGRSVAVTGFMIQPDVLDISPTEGPVGTAIDIRLSGLGWTVYENAPYFVYDNHRLGYVCAVDDEEENGVTHITIEASGDPGLHFIDAYPSVFEIDADEPDYEIKPHLSYLDNHPARPLPAFHFTFEVTEG